MNYYEGRLEISEKFTKEQIMFAELTKEQKIFENFTKEQKIF